MSDLWNGIYYLCIALSIIFVVQILRGISFMIGELSTRISSLSRKVDLLRIQMQGNSEASPDANAMCGDSSNEEEK